MIFVYVAYIPDKDDPWNEDRGRPCAFVQTGLISLGQLIRAGASLSPHKQWTCETLGL